MDLVARLLESEPRTFPPIATNFYERIEDTDILGAVVRRPLTHWQRLTGRRLGPLDHITRLLHFHRAGLRAELNGRWTRADFFWDEVANWLQAHPSESACWRAVAPGLRQRIVEEIVIDTHIALVNGRTTGAAPLAPDDRAFLHANHLRRLLQQEHATRAQTLAVLRPIAESMIEAGRGTENWASCAAACAWLTEAVPGLPEYDNRRAEFLFLAANKAAAPTKQSGPLNLSAIRAGIDQLQQFRREHPDTDATFQALANLYNLEGVVLANTGDCADALVSVERALTFDPAFETAATNRQRMNELMQQMQERARQLDQELKKQANLSLTFEGMQLRVQALKGFGPAAEFTRSAEAAEIREERLRAEAKHIWLLLGYAVPDDDWTPQAQALHDVIIEVFRSPPATSEELQGLVADAFAQRSSLNGLDQTAAIRFLSHRLFGTPWTAAQHTAPPVGQAPSLTAAAPQAGRMNRERVPLDYWLVSRRGLALKLQMAAAVFLILFAGMFGTREALHRHTRNTSYERILTASAAQDWPAVIRDAARFLSAGVLARDSREAQVSSLYAEALFHQAAEQAPVEQYVDQYRRLVRRE